MTPDQKPRIPPWGEIAPPRVPRFPPWEESAPARVRRIVDRAAARDGLSTEERGRLLHHVAVCPQCGGGKHGA